MEAHEYEQVRNMIHDTLRGWHAETVAREDVTNAYLKNINEHLSRLNGSVAKHEKDLYSPDHVLAQCSQAETIKELRDNMITANAIKKYIRSNMIAVIAAGGGLYGAFRLIKEILKI